MRKLIYILVIMFSSIGFTQVYEAGISYNAGQIVGEDNNVGSFFGSNFGITIKKNMNPRIAYRIAATNINSNDTELTEISAGIDFSFKDYNLVRANGLNRGAPYIILEATTLLYDNGISDGFALALPIGVGYKRSLSRHFVGSIEAKGRVALTDKLDSGVVDELSPDFVRQNKTTLDAYYYIGVSLYYTFGWPRGSKNQTRF